MRDTFAMPLRSLLWLAFFAGILAAWWWLYQMAIGMAHQYLCVVDPAAKPGAGL